MSDTTYFRAIVDLGSGPIAEFGCPTVNDYVEGRGYVERDYFRLNLPSLLGRIANLKRDGRDTSEEEKALDALRLALEAKP
jgi:hypothetical protein